MSLIVATSRIDENTLPQSNKESSNFKNFFRSPIEIEADSEIAVQSVKIQRSGNITYERDDFFCHYFGTDPLLFNTFDEQPNLSRTIRIPEGDYALADYERIIKTRLNKQYDDPRTFGGYNVGIQTDASGEEQGLEIVCTDKGPATANVFASLVAVDTFNIANFGSFYKATPEILKSSEFTWTAGSGKFQSDEDNTTLNNGRSIGILTGFPFGLNKGEFTADLTGASAAPFIIGLTRPQIQIETYENFRDAQTITERFLNIKELDVHTGANKYTDTDIRTYDGTGEINGPYEMYDYCFILDENDEITIAQRCGDETQQVSYLQELDYWNNAYPSRPGAAKLTKAQFYATWDGVQFVGVGDEVELYFKQKGKAVYDKVLSSTYDSASPGSCFSPISTCQYALYPQLNVGKGLITITNYDSSNTAGQYLYPTFTEGATGSYKAGNDAFSNEAFYYLPHGDMTRTGGKEDPWVDISDTLCSNAVETLTLRADFSEQKKFIEETDGNYLFAGLNSANGVDYKHLFTMGPFSEGDRFDTLVGETQQYPNTAGRLGFPDRSFIISNNTDGYVSGDDTLAVTFKSVDSLTKTTTSSFIRLPNLTHKSFNGAQSGLSKIVYQLPQFSNDGRQFGSLYFEANEKTYVKLNNTAPMILNMLQVQIVDSQERETTSLTGETQVVFHVRKHNCD